MIAQLETLGATLGTLMQEQHDASLATLEQAVLGAVRAILPALLGEVVRESTRALQAPQHYWRQPCPRGGQRVGVQSWRPRTVQTVCGVLQWERPWYHCRPCGHGFSPADATLGITPHARLRAGLHAWVIELGARTDFREAAALLDRLTALRVSPETVRQHTEQAGAVLEAATQNASQQVLRTQEAAAPLDPAPGQLVVEADGVMVRYRDGWHEVKLGLVAGQVDGGLQAQSYVAARASPEQFGPRLLAEAARRGALEVVAWQRPPPHRGLAELRHVVVLGDGAPWIWNLAAEQFGACTEIVDFYHASEHVWNVAKALHDEATKAAAWAGKQLTALREHGSAPVRTALGLAHAPTPAAAEVLRLERGYFRTNAARMAYPDFHAQRLPIGSGAIESGAKHVVQLRMKRPGTRWSRPGAQGVLNVRCQLLSGRPLVA